MDEKRAKSKKQESKVAKEMSGKVTPASGALWGCKADVRSEKFLVECKTTEKEFYSLTFNVWDKIYNEAIKEGLRVPVMCIDLNNGKERYAVLRTHDLGNYPPKCSALKALKTTSRKMSYRVSCESRFFICNNKEKVYDLSAIPWEDFLDSVVTDYE